MSVIKKLLRIPSGETAAVEAHDTWKVEWWSAGRGSKGCGNSHPRCEVFPRKEDAERFAAELENAARLLADYNSTWGGKWGPFVSKNEYRGLSDPKKGRPSQADHYPGF